MAKKKHESIRKNHIISFRITAEERDALEIMATSKNMKLTVYLRNLLMKGMNQ